MHDSGNHKIYPLMPLRDIVLFPYMVAPLVVGRERSIKALEEAMASRSEIFLAAQKDPTEDEPEADGVHEIGTVASVMQLLRLPDGTIKALVEGKRRARVNRHLPHAEMFMAAVEELPDPTTSPAELVAFMRELRLAFQEYIKHYKKVPAEVVKSLGLISDPAKYVDVLVVHLPVDSDKKQQVLATLELAARFELVLNLLHQEIQVARLEENIRGRVKKKLDKTQKDYYLAEQMRVIQKEMGRDDPSSDLAELEIQLKAKKMPDSAREKVEQELKKLKMMPAMSAEATVVRNYVECILGLPWQEKSDSRLDLRLAEQVLEEDHYGLSKPKERILEYLAVKSQVDKLKGPILCLVGPPGVGKTSICKSVARSMDRRFERLSLGGVRDEAEIRGHRRTYIGAMPGKILRAMQEAKVANPVLCLDEVDKMSMDFRGDPASALLEVLDPEQNHSFSDHYLDLEYDLSDVFFITTANNLAAIPAPLQDRMEIIRINGYTEEDKVNIARGFLVPKQLEANGFARGDIVFTEAGLREIIRRYTREAGVRNLDRVIASICRKVARDRLKRDSRKQYRLTPAAAARFLGVPKHRYGLAEDEDRVGLATGLAWTEAGGELLQIETALMPGKGKLTVTGKLGDVMQESAQAALSYVRTRARCLNLAPDFYQKLDIHVHVPEGAIPKDGPSAGITMATSLVSALLKIPVRREVAMTGEITLRGRVLPIGGLSEKLLAAKRGNIKQILIPKENERNLAEIPAKILKGLRIEPVASADEVLQLALALPEGEMLFKEDEDGGGEHAHSVLPGLDLEYPRPHC
ncbi:endopeptidase La [Desulfurivibrio dismutans]|uniref:endopeptidase La n=1 Tax=Desulfurivibrio dismutans TaxID=1398908 RepID=UPI0023DB6492|nr:endopeptidase La [Desulfurivibrio alkaliphilus]MDF1613615.1 endopeptidase La [Desulfurivibrio alkaliphilus]